MKTKTTVLILITLFAAKVSFAQDNKNPLPNTRTVTTEHGVEVTKQKETSTFISGALEHVTKESNEIAEQRKKDDLTPCQLRELSLREQDVKFLKDHADQIQDIITTVRKGLKSQLSLLKDYKNGVVDGFAKNSTEASPPISFNVTNEDNSTRTKVIYVNDLIQYVLKYQDEASKTPDNAESVKALMAKYSDKSTESKDEFFHMTLEQAKIAYGDYLASSFMLSYKEVHRRLLVVGDGKTMFRVATVTTMGYQPAYRNKLGTALRTDIKDQKDVQLNIVQNFDKAYQIAEEGDYWAVIREMQLTIDDGHGAIPVDGYLRRAYFNKLKGPPDCNRNDPVYTFREKTVAGPYLSFDEKDPCTRNGITVVSATLMNTYRKQVFSITNELTTKCNGKDSFSSGDGMRSLATSLGMGACDDVTIHIEYQCACEFVNRVMDKSYKLGQPINFNCN